MRVLTTFLVAVMLIAGVFGFATIVPDTADSIPGIEALVATDAAAHSYCYEAGPCRTRYFDGLSSLFCDGGQGGRAWKQHTAGYEVQYWDGYYWRFDHIHVTHSERHYYGYCY